MTVLPYGDRILVEVIMTESKSKGGIIIPETAQKKSQMGKVAECPGSRDFAVGDVIMYDKYAGIALTLNDIEYVMLKYSDILATVKD
jgi:chaperonin GroES